MDTREKILSPAQAAALAPAVLVAGFFDPVTASHAERLAALAADGPVTVAILDPPDPLLPARARADLVAALRCVRHVILGDPRGSIRAARTIDETAADTIARQSLIDRIVARSA